MSNNDQKTIRERVRSKWQRVFHSSSLNNKADGFEQAISWYDELYVSTVIARNRYRIVCCIQASMIVLLLIIISMLVPAQHLMPLMVNHYADGRVDVQPIQDNQYLHNQTMQASDLVRYVISRESYDVNAYSSQFALVNQLSNDKVARQFQRQQAFSNHQSPIRILSKGGYRDVTIDSVLELDHKKHLAQVNFVRNDHDQYQRVQSSQPMTALITWGYHKPSTDPAKRWQNWNGFVVTSYHAVQRYVK